MSGFNFDKFVKDQEKRDKVKTDTRQQIDNNNPEQNPNRDFFKKFQEKWYNRVKWSK